MSIQKLSAFSDNQQGGNPAGVALFDGDLPDTASMQADAARIGFSETVFAARQAEDGSKWRVRYFSPESEVPFCGHATIALGAALAEEVGPGTFQLQLNDTDISVEGARADNLFTATLQSPPTNSRPLGEAETAETLALFGYSADQLYREIAPAHIHGGADHRLLVLQNRADLAAMTYDLDKGRQFMRDRGLVTIMLAWHEGGNRFHVRNAFASGGVLEDPATGAAAAAFSGYLRDSGWQAEGEIKIVQGEDMGSRSLLSTAYTAEPGSSVRVSGTARVM